MITVAYGRSFKSPLLIRVDKVMVQSPVARLVAFGEQRRGKTE